MWKESQGTIMVNQKQREDVAYFGCLGNMVTDGSSCTREIKSRIAMAKAAFYKRTLFASKMNLNLWGKPVRSTSFAVGT
jgi:hypothetical protein